MSRLDVDVRRKSIHRNVRDERGTRQRRWDGKTGIYGTFPSFSNERTIGERLAGPRFFDVKLVIDPT